MDLLERYPIRPEVLKWALFGAVALGVATLVVLPLLVMAIPREYFLGPAAPPPTWASRHPVLYLVWRVLRNTLGALLVVLGIVMLVTPGPGLLSMLVGLMLVDFPGKRRMEQRLICRRAVHRHLNWIRGLAGRPPLALPDRSGDCSGDAPG